MVDGVGKEAERIAGMGASGWQGFEYQDISLRQDWSSGAIAAPPIDPQGWRLRKTPGGSDLKNVVLLTGRGGSKSIPRKNLYPILGRPLCYYPMQAAREASKVDEIYVSTDCPDIKSVARNLGIRVIDRPPELARDDSELVDSLTHALSTIPGSVRYLITMHCNCAVHLKDLVDACIDAMETNPVADSCVTGFIDKSVHPFRTKKVEPDGFLVPWLAMPTNTSSNRQNLEPCFILDGAVRVMRVAKCFPPRGQPPFTYLGQRILHKENIGGGDVHSMEDIIVAEYLLAKLGWRQA